MGYVLYFFGHIFQKPVPIPQNLPVKPVSVIICAKNEAANLRQNLPLILSQRYANEAGISMYEVIVVNDASEDDTEKLLYELSAQYEHLRIVNIPANKERDLPGKKFALGQGVSQSAYDLLLMTDADCVPTSELWLAKMVAPLLDGKQLVVGIGKYLPGNNILNAFIRWETLHTFLQYNTYGLVYRPYMAVGRNLACAKAAFLKAREQDKWGKLPSGDDDLLMRANADRDNTAFVTDPQAFTLSPAKENWNDWIKQKQRHLSVGKYYKPGIKAFLSVYASAHALAWLMFISLLFTANWKLAIVIMLLRSFVYWLIWAEAGKKLRETGLGIFFPLFDIGWMIYNFAFSPYIIFKNKQSWK
jgi:glycosyltransferase involved in cell wall biosynthesis